jgi:hypothetical protein
LGSGKDEAIKQLKTMGADIVRVAFADELKDMVMEYFGIPKKDILEKPQHIRDLLQKVGDIVRHADPDYFVSVVAKKVMAMSDRITSLDHHIVISDTRFMNECNYISMYGFNVKVIRNKRNIKYNTKTYKHPSETTVDKLKYDFILYNDGTKEELGKRLEALIKNMKTKFALEHPANKFLNRGKV